MMRFIVHRLLQGVVLLVMVESEQCRSINMAMLATSAIKMEHLFAR